MHTPNSIQPSRAALLKAVVTAVAAGSVILVVAVLPAEYGIDPLGTGNALGLLNLAGAEGATVAQPPIKPTEGGPVFVQTDEYRSDSREFTIAPYESVEYKYELAPGATMLYSWSASDEVTFDFHTEPEGKPVSESQTFERGTGTEGRGAYVAPYAGIHGWFWENNSANEVTVRLKASGFFSRAKLFPFNQKTPQTIDLPSP